MRCPVIYLVLLLFAGCRSEQATGPGGDPEPTSLLSEQPAEVREAYQRFLSAREHLPPRQVQEAGKLYPVDEALQDTAFFVWREQLLQAIRDKDIFTLLDRMDEDIKVSFGAEGGTSTFIEQWNLQSEEQTAQSTVWRHLAEVLSGGGTFSDHGRRFVAPYVAATWPDDQDSHERALITGAGVRIRQQPSLNASIATIASHEFVRYTGRTDTQTTIGEETYYWHEIETDQGAQGYVWGKYLGTPLSYRAVFEQAPGAKWKMVLFLAGD